MNDFHFELWKDKGKTQPLEITTVTVQNVTDPGISWSGSVSGNSATVTAGSGQYLPSGGWIKISFETSPSNTSYYGWAYWTLDGIRYNLVNYDVAASSSYATVEAVVQRAISISITPPEIDFERVRFGNYYEFPLAISVSSNDNWDLYVDGENDPISRGNMLEFLGVKLPSAGTDTRLGGLVTEDAFPLLEDQPPAESFFDVMVYLEPTHLNRPGYYRSYLEFHAIQNY